MACSSSSSLVLTAINATLEDQSFRTRSEVAADALKFWTATCIPYVKKKQCSIPTLVSNNCNFESDEEKAQVEKFGQKGNVRLKIVASACG